MSNTIDNTKLHKQYRIVKILCIILYISGIVYLYNLVDTEHKIAQTIYVDENALLPGAAITSIQQNTHITSMKNLQDNIVDYITKHSNHDNNNNLYNHDNTIVYNWLKLQFKPYFSINTYKYNDIITYSILQPPLTDNKNIIVIIAPYIINTDYTQYVQSHTLCTVLLQYLSTVKWLSSNIMLITVQQNSYNKQDILYSQKQLNKFLHLYRTGQSLVDKNNDNKSSTNYVIHRQGRIQSALVIDLLHNNTFDTVSLDTIGTYGLLSNLDVVSTSITVLEQYNTNVIVCENRIENVINNYVQNLIDKTGLFTDLHQGLFQCMTTAISPQYTYHTYLVSRNVDAITWSAHNINNIQYTQQDYDIRLYRLAASIDSYIRSISNLHEKLHHSTWLYILINNQYFVTMSKYIYALALIVITQPLYTFYVMYRIDDSSSVLYNMSSAIAVYVASLFNAICINYVSQYYDIYTVSVIWSTLLITVSYILYKLYKSINLNVFRLLHTLCYAPIAIINFSWTVLLALIAVPLCMSLSLTKTVNITFLRILSFTLLPYIALNLINLIDTQYIVINTLLEYLNNDLGTNRLLQYSEWIVLQPLLIILVVSSFHIHKHNIIIENRVNGKVKTN